MVFQQRPIGRTGLKVPVYGFGGAPLGNFVHPIPEREARDLLVEAWAAGLTFIDTAPYYGFGLSEHRIGEMLRQVPRKDAVISTKVGRLLVPDASDNAERTKFVEAGPFRVSFDYSYDAVMRSFEDSLQRLGQDRIDILFLHDVGIDTHGEAEYRRHFEIAMDGGYRALDELRSAGVVKAIGLGVNMWEACEAAMDRGRFDVFLLAGRYTLLEQESLETFLPRCEREDVSIVVGGTFNSGILATGAVEGSLYNYEPAPEVIKRKVDRIEAVCRAHGTPMAAAALQFPLTHPSVATVIPGIASLAHLERNLQLIRTDIPRALWTDLKAEGLLRPDAPVPGPVSVSSGSTPA